MDGMHAFYHFVSITLFIQGAMCQLFTPPASSCPSLDNSSVPDNLYINIFREVSANHPNIARQLTMAPFINGMDPNLPAFEFVGLGSGFLMPNLSSAIQEASCMHREVTFAGRVYIRNSQSDGPLLEVAYSNGLEAGRPIYIINMDAAANEITVAFRHSGRLYSEVIPVRLISGKWRDYMVVLSGNQLSFYFDCKLEFQQFIPLPDYCHDQSPVVVSVLNSVYDGVEYVGSSGLMVYVQSLSIEFGQGGNKRVCPSVEAKCPSCGQFLTYLERLTETQEKLQQLEEELALLKEMGVVNKSAVCYEMVNGEQQMFTHGEFLTVPGSKICYCENGTSQCTNLTERLCDDATAAPGTTAAPIQMGSTVDTAPRCREIRGIALKENESVPGFYDAQTEICDYVICIRDPDFGLIIDRDPYFCNRSIYQPCSRNFSRLERDVASCCGLCSDCDYIHCGGANEKCENGDCICMSGYKRNSEGVCEDVNECLTATCEVHSVCVNTNGSFVCECDPGYTKTLDNGVIACKDIDECRTNTDNCSSNSVCVNKEGSFACECNEHYVPGPFLGQCNPTCSPACLNGGTCSAPNTCSCPPQYDGDSCEKDVDECKIPGKCAGGQYCVNTVGGYFCRCDKGFMWDGSNCTDVDECKLGIDNCVGSGSRCLNTIGSFVCFCTEPGQQGMKDCTGSCVRRTVRIEDTKFMLDKCRNCTCLAGEMSCVPVTCNCANRNSWPEGCCQFECARRDCTLVHDGETILIRPGSTWINPSDRCDRYDCSQDLKLTHVNASSDCPVLDCPEQTVPVGKCCPVCLLPNCNAVVQGQTYSIQNGCRVYTCMSSKWVLTRNHTCPSSPSCAPEDIVFYKDGCCPVCRQEILGSPQTQCS